MHAHPALTERQINIDLMLVQRLRRWPNIKPNWFKVSGLLARLGG